MFSFNLFLLYCDYRSACMIEYVSFLPVFDCIVTIEVLACLNMFSFNLFLLYCDYRSACMIEYVSFLPVFDCIVTIVVLV